MRSESRRATTDRGASGRGGGHISREAGTAGAEAGRVAGPLVGELLLRSRAV
jgi:hypothetical protein